MGGSFTSRLNSKLREEKGYTYGASCSFYESAVGTFLQANTSVRRDASAEALSDLFLTFDSAKDGFSDTEWKKSTNTTRNDIISQYESRGNMLGALSEIWRQQQDHDHNVQLLQKMRAFDSTAPTDGHSLFDYRKGVVLIAGDAAKMDLSNWEIQNIDIDALLK